MLSTYGQPITPETIQVYVIGLEDLPLASIVYAGNEAIRTLTEFPTVAHLRKLAAAKLDAELSLDSERALKWLDAYVDRHGADRLPEWRGGALVEPPALPQSIEHALASVGGYRAYAVRSVDSDRERFTREAIRRGYVEFRRLSIDKRSALLAAANVDGEFHDSLTEAAAAMSLSLPEETHPCKS